MSGAPDTSPNVEVVKEYFRRSDARGADVFDLLDDDLEFYFPKHGVGRGKRAFARFGAVLGGAMDVYHDQDTLRIIESADQIVVEGTSYGQDVSGRSWRGGETPGGRFCGVFEVRDGRISRLFIYADPDYPSRDAEGFLWGTDRTW
jgi:ketosteroid isomerase-like protein